MGRMGRMGTDGDGWGRMGRMGQNGLMGRIGPLGRMGTNETDGTDGTDETDGTKWADGTDEDGSFSPSCPCLPGGCIRVFSRLPRLYMPMWRWQYRCIRITPIACRMGCARMRISVSIVRVPVRNKECAGVIVRMGLHTDAPKKRLKSIEKGACARSIAFRPTCWRWENGWGEYYLGSLGEDASVHFFFRVARGTPEDGAGASRCPRRRWRNWRIIAPFQGRPKLTPRQKEVCRFFVENLNEFITRSDLMRREGCSPSVVDALLEKGVLVEDLAGVERGRCLCQTHRRRHPASAETTNSGRPLIK